MNVIIAIFLALFLFVTAANSQTPTVTKEDLQKTNLEIVKLFQQRKYNDALPLAKKAVEIALQVYGNKNLETAKSYRNLGFVQFFINNQKEAEAAFEKSVDIYKKLTDLSNNDGANFAEATEYLAFIKYKNQKGDAESLFETALKWYEKTSGSDSIKTAKSLYALGNISYWRGSFEKSAQYFARLFDVAVKNPSYKEVSLTMVYERTKCAYRKAGKENEFEGIRTRYKNLNKTNLEETSQANVSIKNINSDVVNGKAINLVAPAYPVEAREVRARGEVRVEVLINEEGTVICACAEKGGHPALIEASEAASYRSKFQPTTLDGKPVTVTGIIIYKFIP